MAKKMKSVLTDDLSHCIVTGLEPVHIHHIFGGSNRKHSEEDGYIIPLIPELHNMDVTGIHFNAEFSNEWKRKAQEHWEASGRTRTAFRKRYGRSYL